MVRSILSNWFGLVFSGLISFLLTPLLIHRLGAAYYGMWILAGSLLDYYGLLDIGMRTALFRFVARFKGARQREALSATVATALAITVVTGLLLVALIPASMEALPRFFNLAGSGASIFRWLLLLVGLSLAVTFPARVLGSYLCGLGRFDLYNLAGAIAVLLRAGLILLVLLWDCGVIGIAVVTLITSVLSLLLNWAVLRWCDPPIALDWRLASWTRARELLSYGFYAFLNVMGEYLRSYTDAIVIARVLALALVTPFSIATRLMEYFKSVLTAVGGPLLGLMSELDGRSRSDELNQFFLQSTRFMALLSLFLGSLLLLDGQALIRVWLGDAFVSSYPLALILTAGGVVSWGQHPSLLVVFARARHRPLALLTLAEGAANLVLSIVWARKYGLVGVALGTAVPMLVAKLGIQPWYALRVLGLSAWRYLEEGLARPVALCGVFLAICWLGAPPQAEGGLAYLAASVAWHSALFALLAFTIGMTPVDRQLLVGRGRRLVAAIRIARAG